MKKALALALVLLGLLPAAQAQKADGYERAILVAFYDVDSATYEYPRLVGEAQLGDTVFSPWNEGIKASGRVKTDGSDTVLQRHPAAVDDPFAALAVGDTIRVVVGGKTLERMVTSIASAPDEISVTPALDASTSLSLNNSGFVMRYKKRVVSAGAGDGWFSVRGMTQFSVQVMVGTLVSTSIEAQLECRVNANGLVSTGVALDSASIGAANTNALLPASLTLWLSDYAFDECRVGVKATADAGTDQVTVLLLGRR
jgi:hypothetical protein